jgi:hypothetical protein
MESRNNGRPSARAAQFSRDRCSITWHGLTFPIRLRDLPRNVDRINHALICIHLPFSEHLTLTAGILTESFCNHLISRHLRMFAWVISFISDFHSRNSRNSWLNCCPNPELFSNIVILLRLNQRLLLEIFFLYPSQ